MYDGWIKTYRCIKEHWLWEEKPFDRRSAWHDLLLAVNHQDNDFMFNGSLITVKRGSCITSIRKLAQRWGWSNSKTSKFLKVLENDKMLTLKTDSKKTLITIVNWDKYQGEEYTQKTVKEHSKNTQKTVKRTNKNVKNDKNEKKYIVIPNVDNVKLTQEQYDSLVNDFSKEIVDRKLLDMDNYVTQKNKPYKDYNKALRTWLRKDTTDTEKGGEDERERLYGF